MLLNPVEGLQVYVFAPEAVNVAGSPLQIAVFGETVNTGIGFTVTVVCAEAEHPFTSVPVTVYKIVEEGLAVTDGPVVLLRFVAGLHAYVLAPFAFSVTDCPVQTAAGVLTLTTGEGLMVTVTCAVAVHPDTSPVTV